MTSFDTLTVMSRLRSAGNVNMFVTPDNAITTVEQGIFVYLIMIQNK